MFEKLGDNKWSLILFTIFFSLGLILGVIWNDVPYVTFKREFSLEALVNFILTLFVAMYIPFYINRHIDNKRVEKDMIIDMCKSIIKEIENQKKDLIKYSTSKKISKNNANSLRYKISGLRKKVADIQEMSNNYLKNKQIKIHLNAIDLSIRKYWRSATDKLGDNNPKIEKINYLKAESAMDDCVTSLYRLNSCVNSY